MSPHMADWLARQKLAAAGLTPADVARMQGAARVSGPYRAGTLDSGSWTYGQVALGSGTGGSRSGTGASSSSRGTSSAGGRGSGVAMAGGVVAAAPATSPPPPPTTPATAYALDPALAGEMGSGASSGS
ncbi:unnamed protein product [Peniophora sp. CBMAI 1063]|nr:unnamed protein product [Peniophora sp. CBMAI 1063]